MWEKCYIWGENMESGVKSKGEGKEGMEWDKGSL